MTDPFGDLGQSTVAIPRMATSAPPQASFLVRVVSGPDQGKTVEVGDAAPLLVGTSPACALVLKDRTVSRRHMSLQIADDRLRVCDLASKNGTKVGDVLVGEAFLSGGEKLTLGATVLSVEQGRPAQVQLPDTLTFGRVIGASREMRRLYPLFERLARTDVPVLIEGETGTGKEVLAEALHEQGPRREKPFVVFDCTAVPPALMEAELFGHEKGSFTGAVASRAGLFEQADGGTLFIDEIGDLDLALQPKLLRAIEKSEVRRVGGDRVQRVDVRIIAATRRNLDSEVERGRFRDDLFHRLAVVRVEMPALRDRKGDITLLAATFCTAFGAKEGAIPREVIARWERQAWPGNVRELRNAVARYLAVGDAAAAPEVQDEQLVQQVLQEDLPFARARERVLAAFERLYVQRALEKHHGNVSKAAAAAGIARRYFQIVKARSK